VIETVRRGGVDKVLVVIGRHVPELVPLAESAGAQVLLLAHETPDMRATVERGLHWLEGRFQPQVDDAWLLIPADHPTVNEAVIRRLLQARCQYPEQSIFVPMHAGKRGHPVLIAWSHVVAIRASPVGGGLNEYLRQHTAKTQKVPVDSASICADLDTPADYARLLQLRTKEDSVF
jgi:CTP:molybdopterin cytidylyltransferase MocA